MNTVVPLDKKRNGTAAVTSPDQNDSTYLQYLRTRPAWSGAFDEDELDKPGGKLIAALVACANERREQLQNMARELGVTYGYINQLRNGKREVVNITDKFAEGCADYLGVSRLLVLTLAGRITEADAFAQPNVLEAELPRAIEYIRRDAAWRTLVPKNLLSASFEEQFLVVKLYEKAEQKKLLPESLDIQRLIQELEHLDAEREQRAARILLRVETPAQED